MLEPLSRYRGVVLAALTPVALAAPVVAQPEARPEPDLVEIEVVATNRKGEPVAGLAAADFEVEVDGRPVAVLSATPTTSPAGTSSGAPASHRPLSLVLYFDSTNVDVKRRHEALTRIRDSLHDLQPNDRAMVIAVEGGSVTEVQEFTTEPQLIDWALDRISRSIVPQQRDTEFERILRLIERTLGPAQNRFDPQSEIDSQNVAQSLRAYADQQHQRTVVTCERLAAAVDALASLPARRALVYVGAGMSLNPGEELLAALRSSRAARREEDPLLGTDSSLPVDLAQDTGRIVTELARYASVREVTLYAFDVGSKRSSTTIGAAETGAADLGSTQPGENVTLPAIDFGRRTDLEGSLQLMADETGGVVVRRHQDVSAALDRLLDDREGAYSLAISPADTDPGESYRVRIVTGQDRLRLRHRKSFRAPGEDDLVVELLRSAMLGGRTANPLDAWIESKQSGPLEGDSYSLHVRIRVPVERLALEPLRQSHRAQLTVFSVSSDGDLWTSRIGKHVLPILLPNEEMLGVMGRSIDYTLEMRIFRGREQVALAVRDDLGSEVSVLTLVASPPAESAAAGR